MAEGSLSKYDEYLSSLQSLHELVKKAGKEVEIFRPAEIILPPVDCDPTLVQTLFGIQKKP
jgi:hypothetical protein